MTSLCVLPLEATSCIVCPSTKDRLIRCHTIKSLYVNHDVSSVRCPGLHQAAGYSSRRVTHIRDNEINIIDIYIVCRIIYSCIHLSIFLTLNIRFADLLSFAYVKRPPDSQRVARKLEVV